MAAPPPWRNNLSRFAAVIFDMDGVLVDGEPLHFRASSALFAEEGVVHTLEEHKKHMGTVGSWEALIAAYGLSREPAYYPPRYDELILAEYEACREPLTGAAPLIRGLRAAGTPLAVASSSRLNWVTTCLRGIGLLSEFDAIATGGEVKHGKPAPDIYLLAAERLGIDPSRCLAFEDAPAGIAAAKAAGMTCWAVLTEYTRDIDLGSPDRVFESLADVPLDELRRVAA